MDQSKIRQTTMQDIQKTKFGSTNHDNTSIKDDVVKGSKKDFPDHISDGTHKTKMSKKSGKTVKSVKSDRSHMNQR